jgi:hypothetical protein
VTVQEIELTAAEYKAVEDAAAQCRLSAAEYARLTILGATIGLNAVNARETQRSLANATRTRL